jgi:hypothetical protein
MINRKVAIFGNTNAQEFQNSINEFIKDKYVIDIKFQSMLVPDEIDGGIITSYTLADRAMIIFEDRKKGE